MKQSSWFALTIPFILLLVVIIWQFIPTDPIYGECQFSVSRDESSMFLTCTPKRDSSINTHTIELEPSTTNRAGLMTANDKSNLNTLVTQDKQTAREPSVSDTQIIILDANYNDFSTLFIQIEESGVEQDPYPIPTSFLYENSTFTSDEGWSWAKSTATLTLSDPQKKFIWAAIIK